MARCAEPAETAEADAAAGAVSTDPGNAVSLGSDGLLYVAAGGGGGGAGGTGYTHHQAVAATVWTFTHALGYEPAGMLVIQTPGGAIIDGFGVQIMTPGQTLRLTFDLPIAGTAYVS